MKELTPKQKIRISVSLIIVGAFLISLVAILTETRVYSEEKDVMFGGNEIAFVFVDNLILSFYEENGKPYVDIKDFSDNTSFNLHLGTVLGVTMEGWGWAVRFADLESIAPNVWSVDVVTIALEKINEEHGGLVVDELAGALG